MIQRIEPGPRMSEASIHNGIVYLAGQVAEDPSGDAEAQTRQVLTQIDALLAQAGSDKSRILRAQIYLADIADFAAMNRAWMHGWRPATHRRAPPSRRALQIHRGRWKSS